MLLSWLIHHFFSLPPSPAHALPMFREARQRSTKKQLEKDRLDPVKSHKPEPPVSGPGDVKKIKKNPKQNNPGEAAAAPMLPSAVLKILAAAGI